MKRFILGIVLILSLVIPCSAASWWYESATTIQAIPSSQYSVYTTSGYSEITGTAVLVRGYNSAVFSFSIGTVFNVPAEAWSQQTVVSKTTATIVYSFATTVWADPSSYATTTTVTIATGVNVFTLATTISAKTAALTSNSAYNIGGGVTFTIVGKLQGSNNGTSGWTDIATLASVTATKVFTVTKNINVSAKSTRQYMRWILQITSTANYAYAIALNGEATLSKSR
jgi:hypothetical protein